MPTRPPTTGALRHRPEGHHVPVGPVELFFDLVYVFTIIQLSHHLLADLTWRGALESGILFLAVWWAWNYTAWAMNWLEPEAPSVQALLGGLMLAGLSMAVALPHAFAEDGLWFAASYVVLQVGRSIFVVAAFRGRDEMMARNYTHLLAWSALAAPWWVGGGLVDGDARLACWVVGLAVDYGAPWLGFTLPGRGARPISTWSLRTEHLAERNELVFIIALGESILIMGGTLLELDPGVGNLTATVAGFLLLVLLWWNYFHPRAEVELAPERAAAAGRAAYAYAHGAMVAGAIVVAVGLELVIAHPDGHLAIPTVVVLVVGPTLYLLGSAWLHRVRADRDLRPLLGGAVALGASGLLLGLARDSVAPVVGVFVPVAVLAGVAVATRRQADLRTR